MSVVQAKDSVIGNRIKHRPRLPEQYVPSLMNIVIAGDISMVPGMEVVIYSVMKHNRNVHWHILTMDCEVDHKEESTIRVYKAVPRDVIDFLNFMIHYMDPYSKLTVHDTLQPYKDHLENSVNACTGFSPYAGLRLLLDMLLPEEHAALYLDCDTLCQKDLGWMYAMYSNQDTDYCAYVTPDACEQWGEMVSGVVMFNLDHIRYSGFLERARHNYNHYPYQYPDQTAMAQAADPYKMDETYQYIDDIKLCPYTPAIVHFTNQNKFKIYNTQPGLFYRYYPEFKWIKDGLDLVHSIFDNYNHACPKNDHYVGAANMDESLGNGPEIIVHNKPGTEDNHQEEPEAQCGCACGCCE